MNPTPIAPPGGFLEGGWYEGRRYVNGQFLNPGEYAPGQVVSPEINRQTSLAAGLAPNANQEYINQQNAIINPTTASGGTTMAQTAPLTDLEKQINDVQATINNKKAEADKRRAEVNENPFLSESSRVGRIAKIDSLLNDTLATDQANLTSLQTKLTAQQELTKPDYQITTETDNAGNVTVITVDKKTGKLVSQVSAGKVGKANVTPKGTTDKANKTIITQVLASNMNASGFVDPQIFADARSAWVSAGLGTPQEFNQEYAQMTDPAQQNFNTTYGFDSKMRDKWSTGTKTQIDKLYELIGTQ